MGNDESQFEQTNHRTETFKQFSPIRFRLILAKQNLRMR